MSLEAILQSAGGLGLFLLGMVVMTDGLRALAGGAIRAALVRFTRSPLSGAVTGTVSTALLQSSSATTVAAVGFVGAGLLAFPEALGIILGANVGTTATGWLVALLGFKMKLGSFALPLILAGTMARLFFRGRAAVLGFALAGFGLIFLGITTMQQGMSGLQAIVLPERLPAATFAGRLKLVGLGMAVTVLTQSSSAGVAVTLTALHAGVVVFEQAAALVIGMDVGTTVTAVMATAGGSAATRRTGLSHVIFNCLTASGAFLLLTPYAYFWGFLSPGGLEANGEIALVAFHTLFNVLGVAAILPFAPNFARLVERLVPGGGASYTEQLDRALLAQPPLALNAILPAAFVQFAALLGHVRAILGERGGRRSDLHALKDSLGETQSYLDRIGVVPEGGAGWERIVALIHTLDHMQRLHERCEEEEDRAVVAREDRELGRLSSLLVEALRRTEEDLRANRWREAATRAKKTASLVHEEVRPYREAVIKRVADDKIDVTEGTRRLEAIRWLRRVTRHVARITGHLADAVSAEEG